MLATEQDSSGTTDRAAPSVLLESWPQNERMRHIPTAAWIAAKLDGDLRTRAERMLLPYADLPAGDERHTPLEAAFRSLSRSLERVCEVSRRQRGTPHPPADLEHRIPWLFAQAVANLNGADDTFGRRLPFQTFERSNAEPLWAAVLTVIDRMKTVLDLVREIEPEIDERMLEGLVSLQEPLRRDPIA